MEEKRVSQLLFQKVGMEWYEKNEPAWKLSHSRNIKSRLEKHIYPYIGDRLFSELKANDLLAVLNRLENQGIIETAHRVAQYLSQIYRYAVISGYAEYNVADNLRGALKKKKSKAFCFGNRA